MNTRLYDFTKISSGENEEQRRNPEDNLIGVAKPPEFENQEAMIHHIGGCFEVSVDSIDLRTFLVDVGEAFVENLDSL